MGALDVNGDQNVYIENNTADEVGQWPDLDDYGRAVIRYNTMIGASGLTHDSGTALGQGASRQVELYANSSYYIPFPGGSTNPRQAGRTFWYRAGSGLLFNNVLQMKSTFPSSAVPFSDSIDYTVDAVTTARNSGCCTGWMCIHQPGSSSAGTVQIPSLTSPGAQGQDTKQTSDPMYYWGNIGNGAGLMFMQAAPGAGGPACGTINPATGTAWKTADVVTLNRDVFIDQGARPGWSPFTYPHPLAAALETPIVAPPVFSLTTAGLPNGTALVFYVGAQSLTLTEPNTAGASILYTTDGTTPTHGAACAPAGTSTTYTVPINIAATTTVKAIGCKANFTDSFVQINDAFGSPIIFGSQMLYTIVGSKLAAPVISPAAGPYASSQSVSITGPVGATICVNIVGGFPTTGGGSHNCSFFTGGTNGTFVYSAPFTVAQGTTVNAIATQAAQNDSSMASSFFSIGLTTPTFSPVAGSYPSAQSVTISPANGGATVCFTTDGSTPTANGAGTCTHGTTYSGPVAVSVSETLKAMSSQSGFTDSGVATAAYVIGTQAPASGLIIIGF